MASNDYHFITRWRVPGTVAEVSAVLADAADLPRWWPAVYLEARVLEAGAADGVGRVVELYTKGWLPYTLRWRFRVTESRAPDGFALEAWGDFVGQGVWTFAQEGERVAVTYDWKISAEKPLLRRLSFLLKPIFAANHRWAMRTGEESLKLELRRRQARSATERAAVPPPSGPTFVGARKRMGPAQTLRRPIDPDTIGYCEGAGWAAYYRRDWPRVAWLMVRLNRAQFGMGWAQALAAAVDIVRAAAAFAPAQNDLATTRGYLERFFARARRAAGMRAAAADLAALELDYWVVHRELASRRTLDRGDDDLTPMVDSLARLHAAIFDATPEQMQVSAALRALAAARVDRITGGYSDDETVDWAQIHTLLRDAYRAVCLVEARRTPLGGPVETAR